MTALAAVLGAFGLVALLLAAIRWLGAHRLAAAGYLLQGAVLLAVAGLAWALGSDLATYEAQRYRHPIADVYFEQVAERRYRATLTRLPVGRMQVFELEGDAWRLDARTLAFLGWARDVGLQPVYRLDRLVAVERDPIGAAGAAVSGFALAERHSFDLWSEARRRPALRAVVDAGYAEGTPVAMTDKARFQVSLTDGHLVTQPGNDAAAPPAD